MVGTNKTAGETRGSASNPCRAAGSPQSQKREKNRTTERANTSARRAEQEKLCRAAFGLRCERRGLVEFVRTEWPNWLRFLRHPQKVLSVRI